MISVSQIYHLVRMTSGVFMLVVIGHLMMSSWHLISIKPEFLASLNLTSIMSNE